MTTDASVEFEQAGLRFRFDASSMRSGADEVAAFRDLYVYDEESGTWLLEGLVRPFPYEPQDKAREAAEALLGFLEAFPEMAGSDGAVRQALAVVREQLPRDVAADVDSWLTEIGFD